MRGQVYCSEAGPRARHAERAANAASRGPAFAAALIVCAMLAACAQEAAPLPAATPPATEAAGVRTTPLVPGRRGRVFVFAGVDDACKPLPEPHVALTAPPAKGDVTFVPGQETTIAASAKGTCTAAKARGIAVYYTARAGTSGMDRFTVTATLASGETLRRQFEVTIAE